MSTLLTIIHITVSLFLILVVLLQSGRGGGVGAALGGASGQIFGGRGASSFLSRLTTGAAVVFFLTSLTLSMMSSRHRSVLMKDGRLPTSAPVDDDATNNPNEAATPTDTDGEDDAMGGLEDEDSDDPTQAVHPDAPTKTPPGVPEGR